VKREIPIKCSCGTFRGMAIDLSPANSNRSICLCDDCQAYAHYLGRASDVLDTNGGTDICPIAPAKLKITHGRDHLKSLRLSEKGMIRWYAGCCKSPIANCIPMAKLPFAGVFMTILEASSAEIDQILGPVQTRVQGRFGIGSLPKDTHPTVPLSFLVRTVRFLLTGVLKRQYAPSPFFDSQTAQPVVEPYVLTPTERENLRQFCGPRP
jgi:hypothetical protein